MEVSPSKYCGECDRNFRPGEIVYVTWLEVYAFCGLCKSKVTLINDWETRIVPVTKIEE